jgi:serine/threonine protein kinase
MATVYKAYDLRLQRIVALKILHEHLSSNAELRLRFEQEAKLAARIDHPNVVRIYDFGVDAQGQLFIVSEFIDGRSLTIALRQYMNHSSPCLHPVLAALVALEIARGMEAAHKHSVIHRDLKPDNVLVHSNGDVKLTDFGVARPFDSSMTQVGQFIGSLTYASPEQVQSGKVDARSDIFSFGVILFEILTGQLPFRSSNPTDLAIKISQAAVPPLNQIRPSVPFDLDLIARKCLRADPSQRPQSADQIVGELLRFLSSQEVIPSRQSIADGFENPSLFSSTIRRSPLFVENEAQLPEKLPETSIEEVELELDIQKTPSQQPIQPLQNNSGKQDSTRRQPNAGSAPKRILQKNSTKRSSLWTFPLLTLASTALIISFVIKDRERLQDWVTSIKEPHSEMTPSTSEPNKIDPGWSENSRPAVKEAPQTTTQSTAGQTQALTQDTKNEAISAAKETATPRPTASPRSVPKPTPPHFETPVKKRKPENQTQRKQTRTTKPTPSVNSSAKNRKINTTKSAAPQPLASTQIVVRTEPGEMTVYINGMFEGLSSRTGLSRTFVVPSGNVFLRIPPQESNGKKYQEFTRRFRIEGGKTIELPTINLAPADLETKKDK